MAGLMRHGVVVVVVVVLVLLLLMPPSSLIWAGVDVVLSDEDLALVRRLQRHRYPHAIDPYPAMPVR